MKTKFFYLSLITFLFWGITAIAAPQFLLTWTTGANGFYGVRYAVGVTQIQTWNRIEELGVPVNCITTINWFSTTAQTNFINLFNQALAAQGVIPPQPTLNDAWFLEAAAYHPSTGQKLLLVGTNYQNTSPAAMSLVNILKQIAGF